MPCFWFRSTLQELREFTDVNVCVSATFMDVCVDVCVYVSVYECTEGCSVSREESRMVMSLCLCVFTCTFKHKQWRAHRVVCVCFCVGVEGGGCISIQQWLPMRSVWEVERREAGSGGGKAEQCDGMEQSGLTGGYLIGPPRAPRPAKTRGTAPV